jgi:hypothetical protein
MRDVIEHQFKHHLNWLKKQFIQQRVADVDA